MIDTEGDIGVIQRSEKVLVQAIKAYCIEDFGQELVQGFACSSINSQRMDLFPVCQKHFNERNHEAKYLFSINDGFVQFSHQ